MHEVEPEARLLDHNSNSEYNVGLAARLCVKGARDPGVDLDKEEVPGMIRKMLERGHESTIEHTYFLFLVHGSRLMSHQLVRHRLNSYSQRSQRFVTEDDVGYVVPPLIRESQAAYEEYLEAVRESQRRYRRLLELGVPKEDARFALHQGIATDLLVSFNARTLRHFLKLQCCRRAQWEIREIANQMLALARLAAPSLFENAGPPCVSEGECQEGEMGCAGDNS